MKLLLIIDMLNGFCESNFPLSLNESTTDIQKRIKLRIDEYLENDNILFVCDSHTEEDPEINNPYPPHCMKGSYESRIVNLLLPYSKPDNTITKNTLSVFLNTELENILSTLSPSVIEITGVCTEICILFAAYEFKIRGYNVIVNNECVLPLKPDNQDYFLEYMKNFLGVQIMSF